MIRTCTLPSRGSPVGGKVTIGWANVARNQQFREFIAQRMANGSVYLRIAAPAQRTIIYNNATKDNPCRLTEQSRPLQVAREHQLGEFLESGDVSIVQWPTPATYTFLGRASTPQEVLDNDTIEFRSTDL